MRMIIINLVSWIKFSKVCKILQKNIGLELRFKTLLVLIAMLWLIILNVHHV